MTMKKGNEINSFTLTYQQRAVIPLKEPSFDEACECLIGLRNLC